MLKIKLQGEPLDIPTDITFEYHIKNPFFEDDVIPVPATYTFSVPPTSKNNRLLAYPLRINQETRVNEYDAEIFYGSISIARGIIVRKKTTQNGDISLYFKAQNIEDVLDTPLCELPLQEYQLSQDYWQRELINICEDSFRGLEPFALPIVRTKSPDEHVAFFHGHETDESVLGTLTALAKLFKIEEKLKIMPPRSVYLNPFHVYKQTLHEGNEYYLLKDIQGKEHFNELAPFPYLWHIVDVIFESLGVDRNPFKQDSDLKKVLVSATCISRSDSDFHQKVFKVNRSLPNVSAGDFLKNILKAFGFTLNRLKGNTNIHSYDEILDQEPIADWSKILLDGWTVEEEAQQSLESGFDNGIPDFSVNDIEDKEFREVDTPYYIMYYLYLMANEITVDGVKYKREDIDKTCWYVTRSREFYYSKVDDETRRFWVIFKGVAPEEQDTSTYKKKNRKVSMKTAPMVLDFALDAFSPDYTKMPVNGVYSGEFKMQNRFMYIPYIESKPFERDFEPTLLYYLGEEESYITVPENASNVAPHPRYPCATTNGYNPYHAEGIDFKDIGDYSQIAKQFFEQKRMVLKGKIRITERQIQRLTGIDVIICKGKRWLLKEISIPIRATKIYPAEVTLVEIPPLESGAGNLSFPKWEIWS